MYIHSMDSDRGIFGEHVGQSRHCQRRQRPSSSTTQMTSQGIDRLRPNLTSIPLRIFCQIILLTWLLVVDTVTASVYVKNYTYPSLPGLFGRGMVEGNLYQARLQFLRESPFLCDYEYDILDRNATTEAMRNGWTNQSTFIQPRGPVMGNESPQEILPEPVVLLASRGHCPFQRKAAVAESIDPHVQFLIIYNYHLEEDDGEEDFSGLEDGYDPDDVIVPMYSEMGNTRLVLLSVSYNTGQALKRLIRDASEPVKEDGGPLIFMDSTPPDSVLDFDLTLTLINLFSIFVMFFSMASCAMVIMASCSNNGPGGGQFVLDGSRIMFVESGSNDAEEETSADNLRQLHSSRNPNERQRLLSESQVHKVASYSSQDLEKEAAMDRRGEASASRPPTALEEDACAICIDEFDENDDDIETMTLPCHHKFHMDCIVPWLTQRQCKCPLCKFDVLDYLIEKEEERAAAEQEAGLVDSPTTASSDGNENESEVHGFESHRSFPSWLGDMLRRGYRFSRVDLDNRAGDVRDGVIIAPEEMEMTSTSRSTARNNHEGSSHSI